MGSEMCIRDRFKNYDLKKGKGSVSFSEEKRKAIQLYMLEKIRMDDTLFLKKTAEVFSISETSVRRYVKMCIDKKLIEVSNKNQCGYRLVTYEKKWSVSNDGTLEEDQIFYAEILPELKEISKNAKDIWAYTFAEIMNNAIEHSEAEKISYAVKRDCLYTEISIVDDGIGVFKNIQKYLLAHGIKNVSTEQAVLELYKGKLTTNLKEHSGEGIFFSSRMLTEFAILSDHAIFSMKSENRESFIRSHLIAYYTRLEKVGTMVVMKLENQPAHTSKDIFDRFAPIERGFVRTEIPMREMCPLGNPVARSQARRILRRLDEFEEIIFDFQGIDFMGQGFADEIFRVFQNRHPSIRLIPVNANESVLGMIHHVTVGKIEQNQQSEE